jgi:hypothetical protein
MDTNHKMTAFDCYKEYVALKNHFTQKGYDYIKYNGKTSVKADSFYGRKDKIFFEKLAKHKDPKGFLIANLVEDSKMWIKDLAYNEQAQSRYTSWIARKESLTYIIKSDLSKLKDNFDDNFLIEDYDHPHLLKLLLRKEICIETFVVLVDITQCHKHWNKKMKDDPIWDQAFFKYKKYISFINYDKEKIKLAIVDKFS